jgi:hypothetical protein
MNPPVQEVQFVDEVPGRGGSGKWTSHLMPLMKRPGVWARIWTCENIEKANSLQSNLHSRAVFIPEPKHDWEFAARGCEVYAVYRGKARASSASVRRANRGG